MLTNKILKEKMTRKEFIKKAIVILFVLTIFPKDIFAKVFKQEENPFIIDGIEVISIKR